MDCLGNIVHIVWCEVDHWDTAIFGHVNGRILLQFLHLFLGESRVAEHANLLGDVRPITSRAWGKMVEGWRHMNREEREVNRTASTPGVIALVTGEEGV